MARTSICCPLCEFEGERTAVYQHLQTSHRKHELSRRILADEYGEFDRVEVAETGPGTVD